MSVVDKSSMKMSLYSVEDLKSGYLTPFTASSDGVARRMFESTLKDRSTVIGSFPEDFRLFYVGTFIVDSGEMVNSPHRLICDGKEFMLHDREKSEISK